MKKVKEKTPLECLKEEIRIYRKNEKATYDMLALYELLLQGHYIHNLMGITLTEKVIHDFEDPEVTVPLIAKDINDVLNFLNSKFSEILRKYKDMDECKEYCNNFCVSYKNNFASKDISSLFYQRSNRNFDLIKELLRQSPSFVYKFLVSEIPFETRLKMFINILKSYNEVGKSFYYFIHDSKLDYLKDYLTEEECITFYKKKQEIIDALNKNEYKDNVRDLLNGLVNNEKDEYIAQLQNYGIDFNLFYAKYDSKSGSDLDGKSISTVGVLISRKKTLSSIIDLYECDSYLKVECTVRNNNDLLILDQIDLSDISSFIELSHFEVTEEKIRFLASVLLRYLENYDISTLTQVNQNYELGVKEIANIIIHKAKNKEEYKKMVQYAKLFLELTDLDKEIAKRKKEEQLLKNRQVLTSVLHNINEQALLRILVKDITFKE